MGGQIFKISSNTMFLVEILMITTHLSNLGAITTPGNLNRTLIYLEMVIMKMKVKFFPQSDFSSTIFSAISYICCQAHDCFKKVLHSGDFSCRRIQPWSKEDLKADTIDSLHPPPSMLLSDDIS